jgi:2-polyprenyl-3-methyl-5-hydroxy-6-metoxy-1,4-benzoquinol methylase
VSTAADRWREDLAAWAIPSEILDQAEESPYGWPEALWKRRASRALDRGEWTPTTERVAELAGSGGSILDIGAGTGRASLPLARAGHPVTAVERNAGMLRGLREMAAGSPVTIVEGSWPEVGEEVGTHDVAMCAHVVYDIADIGPFLRTMAKRARRGVVVELTAHHPWSHLTPYYLALHGLQRPAGPTAEDLAEVVSEEVGVKPSLERWERPPDLWFESREEILELYGRRLVVPRRRWDELGEVLEPDIISRDEGFVLGSEPRVFATVWWAAG